MERLFLAKFKAKKENIIIIRILKECFDGMSPNLLDIAERLENQTEINRSIWMNIMKSRLMMELTYYNTRMVQQCYNLFAIEDNIN